jgi:CRP-like cAMP-binding protein
MTWDVLMASRSNLETFLARLTKRSMLSAQEQQAVLGLPGHAEQVRANHDFVRLGQRVDTSCLVVAGIVGRFTQSREGARQITALHIPGDMCDLHSVVQPVPTSALQALSIATIVRVPHAAIRAIAAEYPAVAEAFWRDCEVDAAILAEWVVNVGRRDGRTRIAHLLCEMATRLADTPTSNDFVFDFPVTQMQLADATAMTAVHVNRTLQALRAEGLIEWQQRIIRVPDWSALAAVAEFDAAYLQTRCMPARQFRFEIGPAERPRMSS